MTDYQKTHEIGSKVSGTFSKLHFSGIVVAHVAECVVVKVENPHHNLPIGYRGGLCFHPSDTNVVLND